MSVIRPIFFVIIIALIVFFLGNNLGTQYITRVNLIQIVIETETGWVILVSAALGAFFMLPYLAMREIKYHRLIRKMKREQQNLNANISQLQNLPIDDTDADLFQE